MYTLAEKKQNKILAKELDGLWGKPASILDSFHAKQKEYFKMFYENTFVNAIVELEKCYGIQLFSVTETYVRVNSSDLPF